MQRGVRADQAPAAVLPSGSVRFCLTGLFDSLPDAHRGLLPSRYRSHPEFVVIGLGRAVGLIRLWLNPVFRVRIQDRSAHSRKNSGTAHPLRRSQPVNLCC